MKSQQIISLLVHNHPGVLLRVTSLFTRRGFNIDSLTVSETNDTDYSRMTIVIQGDDFTAKQFINQALKIDDVKKAVILNSDAVCAELMLIKVKGNDVSKITAIAQEKGLTVKDISGDIVTILAVGSSDEELQQISTYFSDFDIIELVRTGLTALQKGNDLLKS